MAILIPSSVEGEASVENGFGKARKLRRFNQIGCQSLVTTPIKENDFFAKMPYKYYSDIGIAYFHR